MNYLLEDKVICTRDIATDWQHHVRLSSVGQRNSPEFLLPGRRPLLLFQYRYLGAQHCGRLSKETSDCLQFHDSVVAGYRSDCVQQRLKDGANALLHLLQVMRLHNHAAPICGMRVAAPVTRTLQSVHDAGDRAGREPRQLRQSARRGRSVLAQPSETLPHGSGHAQVGGHGFVEKTTASLNSRPIRSPWGAPADAVPSVDCFIGIYLTSEILHYKVYCSRSTSS